GHGMAGSSAPISRATRKSSARRSASRTLATPLRKACRRHGSAPTLEGCLSKVRRGYKHRLIVGDNSLRMENAAGTFGVKCSRVIKHVWTRRSGPVGLPEMIGKPTHQLFRSGRVVPLALDVQEQRDTEFRR